MENILAQSKEQTVDLVMSPEMLLEHWQGHRSLTRRVIEKFPENEFFTFSIGGMRPYLELTTEMLDMATGGIIGVATGKWPSLDQLDHVAKKSAAKTKQDYLDLWDNATELLNKYWKLIPPGRFQEIDKAFGLYEAPIYGTIFYFIDNEIHHRGQGYVYLRALGIEPPPFWER